MFRNTLRALALLAAPICGAALTPLPTLAQDAHGASDHAMAEIVQGDLTITAPFALETPPNAPVAGGYLQITNRGEAPDRLLAVSVAPDLAGRVELHEMRMAEGVMQMRELAEGIAIPAGETVTLERGGLHLMFLQLSAPFVAGAEFAATLQFERAGEVEVTFRVMPRGAAGAHTGHGAGHGN